MDKHIFKKITGKLFTRFGNDQTELREDSLSYFKDHIMDPSFDWKKYQNTPHPYFSKWGLKYSTVESEYYAAVNGIKSDLYIPTAFFYNLMCPYINRLPFRVAYQDKNMLRKILGADRPNKKIDFKLAKIIAANINGIFYNGEEEVISEEQAIKAIMDYPEDLILKPCVDTTWGKGVTLVKASEKSEESVKALMNNLKINYNFQERIQQHHLLAAFNPSSLNTTRIATYRRMDGSIRVLYAFQRFGKNGAVIDNVSAGGCKVPLDENGKIVNRKIIAFKKLDTKEYIDSSIPDTIPYFDLMAKLAIYLHGNLPYFNLIGWDITVDENGMPFVVEFNTMPASEFQLSNGPSWTKEELDELMPHIMQYKHMNNVTSSIWFADRPGFENKTNQLFD